MTVRRTYLAALALTILIAVISLLGSGCARSELDYNYDIEVAYYIDGSCGATDKQIQTVAEGFALWQDWGAYIVELDAPMPWAVAVCIGTDEHEGKGGATTSSKDGWRIWIGSVTPQVAAHEFGHVILDNTFRHLPRAAEGIMASSMTRQTAYWSAADEDFIIERFNQLGLRDVGLDR